MGMLSCNLPTVYAVGSTVIYFIDKETEMQKYGEICPRSLSYRLRTLMLEPVPRPINLIFPALGFPGPSYGA